jgi:hypothetical protein
MKGVPFKPIIRVKYENIFELKPRCALFLSVIGAYNSGYEVRLSARGSPKLLPTVATSHIPTVVRNSASLKIVTTQ